MAEEICGPKILDVETLDKEVDTVIEEITSESTIQPAAEEETKEEEEEEEEEEKISKIVIELKANKYPCEEDIDCDIEDTICAPYKIINKRDG